jgi:hypothetical protein
MLLQDTLYDAGMHGVANVVIQFYSMMFEKGANFSRSRVLAVQTEFSLPCATGYLLEAGDQQVCYMYARYNTVFIQYSDPTVNSTYSAFAIHVLYARYDAIQMPFGVSKPRYVS